MKGSDRIRIGRVLLVEDSLTDIELTEEAFAGTTTPNELDVVCDGEAALAYLRAQGAYAGRMRPDLVLLDLNLPRKDGREVLAEIKQDPDLSSIPVIVLTTSGAPDDVVTAYASGANAYIRKPVHFDEFIAAVQALDAFWMTFATLPTGVR